MRTHIAATALLLAVTGLALGGCGSSSDTTATAPESAVSSQSPVARTDQDKTLPDAGMPSALTDAERVTLIAALQAINPDFAKDPDKAIDAARQQCSAINSNSAQADAEAAKRFTYHGNELTEAQGKAINDALKRLKFCGA
ncbi:MULTISPECIES: hypothetical protein [unclassified Streptomyces]|uniref:hypothetical protein n=1 Tax=unclassified Streptomyces TaxID=2593676 RepID=UPI00037F189C|nr:MULTISPECIES: hypothetical protein [unclassified Streptomyces]MYX36009.1 hypothetical protein [Streptomyces sp. SID8377]